MARPSDASASDWRRSRVYASLFRFAALMAVAGLASDCEQVARSPKSATRETSAKASAREVAPSSSAAPQTDLAEDTIDLSITFHPGVTGNSGWVKLPKPISLDMLGDSGAAIVDLKLDHVGPPDSLLLQLRDETLRRADLADTALLVDENAVCSESLLAAVTQAHPRRLLVSVDRGITSKVVACLRALPTARLYVTGCLFRSYSPNACDGDSELDALASDEALRPRIRGLAVSIGRPASLEKLSHFPALEYLALSPGPGARDVALFDDLPFDDLPRVRYVSAEGENAPARSVTRDAARFLARLHTLRLNGEPGAPLPSPCMLERASFGWLDASAIGALAACTRLTELSTDSARFDAATALAPFTALVRLHLRNWPAKELSPLRGLAALRELSLPASAASNFDVIAQMPELHSVDLSQGSLTGLSPFAGLTSLEDLDVHSCPVSDPAPIATLSKLQRLDLGETKVTDIAVIAHLPLLRELSISETAVADVRPLASHPALERVLLYGSHVTDVSALLTLPKLKRAHIGGLGLPKDQVQKLRERLKGELLE